MTSDKRYYKSVEIKKRFNITLFLIFSFELALFYAVSYVLGGISILLTIGILLIKSGIEIDLDNERMRDYVSIFGIELGTWTNIPKLKYISIVRVKLKRKSFKFSAVTFGQSSSNKSMFNVNLITEDKRKRYIKVLSAEKEESITTAIKIAELLELKVLDYTSFEKKWIR